MFRNYFKTAIRTFIKQKGYTFINISGLTVGLASSLLILLWINDEVSFDKFHNNDAKLYQVMRNMYMSDGQTFTNNAIPKPLQEVLLNEYPEIGHAVLFSWENELLFQYKDKTHREIGRFASPDFFQIFSFPFLIGDHKTALNDIHSVVISEKVAAKIFGNDWAKKNNVINQLIRIDNRQEFKVTGVFESVPSNSSLQFDFIIPVEEYNKRNGWVDDWGNNGLRMALTLNNEVDIGDFNKKIEQEINKHFEKSNSRLFIQKYSDRYLYSSFENGLNNGGRIDYVKTFFIVAIFIMVIASINFMNLATARSTGRAKEIGVRKLLGARSGSLRVQFMIESILITIISVAMAVVIVQLLIPAFNELTGKKIVIDYLSTEFWAITLGISLFTGVLSGSYPALFLSSFKITKVIKGTLKHTKGATFFRQGLVVFQFGMSILLIIGTITVYNQISYIMSKNLGLDKENLIYFELEGETNNKFDAFKNELLKLPQITNVTSVNQNPISIGVSTTSPKWVGKNEDDQLLFNIITTNFDFVKTLSMELVDGRDFEVEFINDSASFIINEESARVMGMDNPIGQPLTLWGTDGKIIGLVKDFHMNSMYQKIEPVIIRFDPEDKYYCFIRFEGDVKVTLAGIKEINKTFNPSFPFTYQFLDENFEKRYNSEKVVGNLASYFAVMAIFISCLGLFGLASYTVEQRTKEIGIRKVLGATITNLVVLLSNDFIKLIVIAFLISSPIAYYFADGWLDKFVYKTDLQLKFFAMAGLGALIIAGLTVSFKSLQAAMSNPTDSLKDE